MLNIGKIYRANSSHNPVTDLVDNLPNYYHETFVPNKKKQIIFERGISKVEEVIGSDGLSRIPLIIISSSPHKSGTDWTPWSDIYDPDHGIVMYYGDNKIPGENPLGAGHNNSLLLNQLDIYNSPDAAIRQKYAVPIVFFERVPVNGRLKGNLKFQGFGILEKAERVTQYNSNKEYFSNYRFSFCVFSLNDENENFNWKWIIDRCNPDLDVLQANINAPQSWKKWIKYGSENLQRARRNVSSRSIIKSSLQIPSRSADLELLKQIYAYYSSNKADFEWLALEITRKLIEENGGKCPAWWVTQSSSDGGIDFVLRMDVGTDPLASIKIVVLGQAKCTDLESPINGKDIARTVARLKRGWIGSFVTTSYFSEKVQQEINEDKYPIILINGATLAKMVRNELFRSKLSLPEYLESIKGNRENRNPDDILSQ